LNTKVSLEKFHSKSDEGILLDYSKMSKACRVYKSTMYIVEESIHVRFNDYKPNKKILA